MNPTIGQTVLYKPTAEEVATYSIDGTVCPAIVMAIDDDNMTLSLMVMYLSGVGGGTFSVDAPINTHDEGSWK